MNIINIEPLKLHSIEPDQESVHPADLGTGVAHPMGYAPVSKVLSTYTRVEVVAVPLPQPEDVLVIRGGQPQVGHHPQHRHPHHAWPERVVVVVVDQHGVAQNRVTRRAVSPMTIAEYRTMQTCVKITKFIYCGREKI